MMKLDPRAWPIRWRLTALNVGLLAATLMGAGGMLLLQLDNALIDITADHLRDQARPAAQIVRGPRQSSESTRSGQPFTLNLPRAATGIVRALSGPETGVSVFDADGTVIASSPPSESSETSEAWPRPSEEQIRATLGGAESSMVVNQQTRRTLLLLLPLRAADETVVGVLALSSSLQLSDHFEARLRQVFILGALVAMLIAGGIGLRATRAALQPLDDVIDAARKIGAGRLDERLRLKRRDEIGELAEAFDSMLDRLAGVLSAQRQFVADAAHELRTPLTALGGMVEMLQIGADRGDPATFRRMLNTMEREIGRLTRLVSDLLTLSRLEAQQTLKLAPVELAPLLGEIASQARLLASGQNVRLSLEAKPIVLGDADRLRQVLINLVDNALAFTPAGGEVHLSLAETAGSARLVVADNGTGIAPEVLPRVMDRFVRGDPSRARATGGSGLGLSIARGIVEALGGSIMLNSRPGQGTTVTITLPRLSAGATSANLQLSRTEDSASTAILEEHSAVSHQRGTRSGRAKTRS
jgi:signal transduction histidine kinase